MSYILEALRRAQAERERGEMPGLHTTAAGGVSPQAKLGAARPGLWLAAGLGLGLAVAAAAAAWMLRPLTQTPQSAPAAQVTPPTAGPSSPAGPNPPVLAGPAAPIAALTPPAALPERAPLLPRVVSVPSMPSVPSVASATAKAPAATPRTGSAEATSPAAGRASPSNAPVNASASAAAISAQGRAPPVRLADLPADLRRELPPLVLGGSIWSENAASRFVIVNGQVVREGEAAAPGVLCESVGPKSVVLHWREMRIEVPL